MTSSREYNRQIADLNEQIGRSEGYRVWHRSDALGMTIQVFKANHRRLSRLLRRFREDRAFAFGAWKQRADFFTEVHILHHNFLASVKTLADHTRIYADEVFGETERRAEYQRHVDETFDAPLPRFVQRLRNYVLHYRLPLTLMALHGNRPAELLIDVDELRAWDGWTARAREYLDGLGSREPVHAHADAYESVAESFYMWFDPWVLEVHRAELDQYRQLSEQMKELERLRDEARQAERSDDATEGER